MTFEEKVLLALISAGIGSLLSLITGVFRERRDRKRRRKSLATVYVCELRSLEISLRKLFERPGGRLPSNAYSVFDRSNSPLELFRPETARLVLDVATKLQGVKELIDLVEKDPSQVMTLKAHIAGVVGLTPRLKGLLEKEGGKYIPFEKPVFADSADDGPKLILSSFDDIKG